MFANYLIAQKCDDGYEIVVDNVFGPMAPKLENANKNACQLGRTHGGVSIGINVHCVTFRASRRYFMNQASDLAMTPSPKYKGRLLLENAVK